MGFYSEDELVEKEESKHDFTIKYKDEDERKKLDNLLLDLIQKFELKNFSVNEEKAFQESRIIYNEHTIISETEGFSKEKLEKNFQNLYIN